VRRAIYVGFTWLGGKDPKRGTCWGIDPLINGPGGDADLITAGVTSARNLGA